MWRGVHVLLSCLNVAVLSIFAFFLLSGRIPFEQKRGHIVVEYKDFVSILLTAVAVMIAVLTIFVAVAAFWGFAAVRDAARETARGEAGRIAPAAASQAAIRTLTELTEQTRRQRPGDDVGAAAGEDKHG